MDPEMQENFLEIYQSHTSGVTKGIFPKYYHRLETVFFVLYCLLPFVKNVNIGNIIPV